MEMQTKDELLEQISLAIEQIQKQFVPGGNAIKDCQETFFLCQCIDNILHHGLKEGLISWAVEPTIWPLLEKITCSKDIEEIKMLKLKSDKEKCNAWIKMAVNENLLGSYIDTINQDQSLLSNHYCDYAFLRDPVMAGTVKYRLNYGIANFEFQISVSQNQSLKQPEISAGQEHSVANYDSFELNKLNGFAEKETGIISQQETWSKKKRKKKKQSVNTVIISEQNDYDGQDDASMTETARSNIVQDTPMEEVLNKDENDSRIHEDDKLLEKSDTQHSNTVKSPLTTIDQSAVNTVNDVETKNLDIKDGRMINTTTGNEVIQVTEGDNGNEEPEGANSNEVTEGADVADKSKNHSAVFASNDFDQYLLFNNENTEATLENKKRKQELDSLGRITERPSSRQAFSANDFLLEDAEPAQDPSGNAVSNLTESNEKFVSNALESSNFEKVDSSTYCKVDSTSSLREDSDFANFPKNCERSNSGEGNSNLAKSEKVILERDEGNGGTNEGFTKISENEDLSSSRKSPASQKADNSKHSKGYSDTNEDFQETLTSKLIRSVRSQKSESEEPTGSNKDHSDSNEEFSGILSSGRYDYRVRKVENPEFVSSYGSSSAMSDFTDDDRDLNFIPGIHRLSSKSFSSSFERKSTEDSLLSFDENGLPLFESSHYTDTSSSLPSSVEEGSRLEDMSNEWDMFEDLLNVEEEHFSKPDNFAGLTTIEELEMAIEHYKKLIKIKQDKSKRDGLVKKLVKLRLRLQKERDGPPVENPKVRKILSHQFSKTEGAAGTKYFCDQCGKNIWTMWQSLFTCNDCGYHSHKKCLEHIQRPCPNKNLSSASYILDICPDTALDAQQYRCAECRKEIAFSKDDVSEARICDYTGQYFCENCHWNDQTSIPARVLRNWDFTQHKVCRKTKQLLELMKIRPILDLQQINPMLYRYVEELREVGKLREDILIMKKYFLTCREALESKLLVQLQKRQHFVDSAYTYSFQDLIDLNNDVLLPEISKIHALFLAHIKADCELCRARGFICEVCRDSSDVIFAFDPHAVKCRNCSAVFHKICFKAEDCPKCERKKRVVEQT